jgi:hypothetical protein
VYCRWQIISLLYPLFLSQNPYSSSRTGIWSCQKKNGTCEGEQDIFKHVLAYTDSPGEEAQRTGHAVSTEAFRGKIHQRSSHKLLERTNIDGVREAEPEETGALYTNLIARFAIPHFTQIFAACLNEILFLEGAHQFGCS